MSKTTKTAQAAISVKAVGDERKVTFVVSSSGLDRDYERVDVKSLRIPLKGGNYVVAKDLAGQAVDVPWLLNHSFDVEDCIGSVRKATYDAVNDELVFEFGVSARAKAQDMMLLIEEGHLDNAVSITMSDYTYGTGEDANTIYDAELIEVSLVFRGSNKDARLLAVKSLIKGEDMADAKTLAEKRADLEVLKKEVSDLEAQGDPHKGQEKIDEAVANNSTVTGQNEDGSYTADIDREAIATAIADDKDVEAAVAQSAETPVVEAPKAEEDPSKEEPAKDEEEQPPQESKSIKQETPKMKDNDVAIKQVKDAPAPEATTPKEKGMDKYDFVAKQFVAWVNGDNKTLSELNEKAIESHKDLIGKATYMNTGVVADGGAIVPNAELLSDIYTTLTDFSTVAGDLKVVTLTDGNSIDYASLLTDVIMTEVGSEGGNKAVTKPTLAKGNVALREFAGIALITKKLVRQASISVYDLLRESFARAIANQRAVLALTDSTSGIANVSGTVTVTAAATHTTVDKVTWSDIRKMPYAVPVATVQGGKYYISRELLMALDMQTDTTGRDLEIATLNGDGLSGRFKNGFDFAVEDVLGKSGAPHAIFGAMGRFGFLLRQGVVESETFDTGSVTDGSSVVHNLLQQNKLAQRVAFYENVGYPVPGAFAKLALASS